MKVSIMVSLVLYHFRMHSRCISARMARTNRMSVPTAVEHFGRKELWCVTFATTLERNLSSVPNVVVDSQSTAHSTAIYDRKAIIHTRILLYACVCI